MNVIKDFEDMKELVLNVGSKRTSVEDVVGHFQVGVTHRAIGGSYEAFLQNIIPC